MLSKDKSQMFLCVHIMFILVKFRQCRMIKCLFLNYNFAPLVKFYDWAFQFLRLQRTKHEVSTTMCAIFLFQPMWYSNYSVFDLPVIFSENKHVASDLPLPKGRKAWKKYPQRWCTFSQQGYYKWRFAIQLPIMW